VVAENNHFQVFVKYKYILSANGGIQDMIFILTFAVFSGGGRATITLSRMIILRHQADECCMSGGSRFIEISWLRRCDAIYSPRLALDIVMCIMYLSPLHTFSPTN
jgi:hypothetical protein